MTTVNVGTTKNTVTVNGETRVVTVKTGEVRVVTVKVAGPQGPAIPDGNKGDVSISSNGTAISINTGAVTSAKILDGTIVNADINGLSGDANKVSYHLPAMGGLTAGVSFMNSGAAGSADSTEFGAKYSMDAGGAAVTLGFATGTTEASSQDTDTTVIGVKVSSGNITAAVSQSTYEAAAVAFKAGSASSGAKARVADTVAKDQADEESTGAAVSFKVNDATTVTLHTAETEDGIKTETYSNSGIEIKYTIASGLTAYINVEDYDYKKGTGSAGADNAGTASKLTIKATF